MESETKTSFQCVQNKKIVVGDLLIAVYDPIPNSVEEAAVPLLRSGKKVSSILKGVINEE